MPCPKIGGWCRCWVVGSHDICHPCFLTRLHNYKGKPSLVNLLEELLINPDSRPPYDLKNKVLQYKGHSVIKSNSELRDIILYQCQNSAIRGHSENKATYKCLKQHICWSGIKQLVAQWIQMLWGLPKMENREGFITRTLVTSGSANSSL